VDPRGDEEITEITDDMILDLVELRRPRPPAHPRH
jgi:hypothetical protein